MRRNSSIVIRLLSLWAVGFGLWASPCFLSYSLAQTEEMDDCSLKVRVDRWAIFIGDRIRYAVEISSRDDLEIKLPEFKDGKIGDFEIKEAGGKSAKSLFGQRTYLSWYLITAYTPGKYQIPSVEIKYRKKGHEVWRSKKTDEISITVESILPKKEKMRDIREIKGPASFREINWPLILTAAVIGIAGLMALDAYRRKKNKVIPKLPHQIALEELESIRKFFVETGNIKEYYVRICDCVRHYIERAFKLKAPEMTTEEFLVSMKDSRSLSIEEKALLKDFMEACDLVKFAKYAPTKAEIEAIYTSAKRFIDQTKDVSDVRL